ncbi:MAG: DNA-3-methyladenine glycosylase [Infirmifilum sp.]|jgi:DNA-3-methyladenine glycosylase|uniref:Putative 3-methyladenine DNA glycosylase n=1 Tax=Infirmifilum uzonense TaxID=1550241 RepID=A0A0F7FGW5_9CREN|nr:DNA-3-methyladenine glycosylase [Infirmifilum uzonense]AKG38342.1 methylpurine-DNA glycosylase [Infirmifilum uzonense]
MQRSGKIILQDFFARKPDTVARQLLGKLLVNIKLDMAGVILETEPYFGPEDPASRARKGGDLARTMASQPCTALVYGVHRQWLLNIVAHEPNSLGAVLIRGILPVNVASGTAAGKAIWGPGRVTRYLGINKDLHKKFLCSEDSEVRPVYFLDIDEPCVSRSSRIGVREDLPEPLNFKINCIDEINRMLKK